MMTRERAEDGAYDRWLRERLHCAMTRLWSHKPWRCREHDQAREDIGANPSHRSRTERYDYGRYICPMCFDELATLQLEMRREYEATEGVKDSRFARVGGEVA